MLRHLSNHRNPSSLASEFRRKRFSLLLGLLSEHPGFPKTILDVGGEPDFWDGMKLGGDEIALTILNQSSFSASRPGILCVVGDARWMPEYADQSYDLVVSNSVIEHLGTWEDQVKMANEIRRIGRGYFVQTPSFWFPVEPHFLVPGFQWLPFSVRVLLVRWFRPGWYGRRVSGHADAVRVVKEMRLLTARELKTLFPDADTFFVERFGFWTKSYVAIKHPS